MAFTFISGQVFSVEAATADEAWALFQKHVDGTATAEESALVSDTGVSSFEISGETGGPVGDGTI